ncbi:MAG: hypothetical protein NTW74_22440 [Acidobacteria bacterium]|nr:hypothetical protein [Acidobacteriota bacterium]
MPQLRVNTPKRLFLAGLAASAAIYATYVGTTWLTYAKRKAKDHDPLLDTFMPNYEVAERHTININAPAHLVFSTALQTNLEGSAIIRALFRSREALLGGSAPPQSPPKGLFKQLTSLGWGMLAQIPGQEIVMGAATQPWEANPVFRPIPPHEFEAFSEPNYVKIAWTLSVESLSPTTSKAITETRVQTTSPEAREKFRIYWAFLSPGILLIRRALFRQIKKEAELNFTQP